MHWLLVRVLHLHPMLPENGRIVAALDAHLSPASVQEELNYFGTQKAFERPYGWAWLLELQAEALRGKTRWARALEALAREIAQRTGAFFSASPYPIRAG